MAITPDYVLSLRAPTSDFLCPWTKENEFGIDFISFEIKSTTTNLTMFSVKKDPNAPFPELPVGFDVNRLRSISYRFPALFLDMTSITTSLEFKVGNKEVKNFRMIERHYFRGKLIRNYDFSFGFCIPNSVNSWEAIYDMPELTDDQRKDMIANPYEAQSDSFYFVDDKLIMQNKASYFYDSTLMPK